MKYYSDMLPDEYKNIKLCVLVPCYNEEESIEAFYAGLIKNIEKYNYTVLFIDDGSTDRTIYKLRALAALDHRISYLSLSRNFGQQHALKAGYDHIQGADCVISMDADLQHPPEYIGKMVQKWLSGYEIVNTIRENNHKVPLMKQLMARGFYTFINCISANKIIINGPDYRLLDKKVVEAIQSFNESNIYFKELISWLGFKQCTVPFEVNRRCGGTSKYSFKKQLSLALTGVTSFSINPLRVSTLVGAAFSLLAFIYGFYALYIYFFTDRAVTGWTSLIASVLFIAGLQFIMIGIIGEYLGKTFLETKKRPLYIVNEASGNIHISDKVRSEPAGEHQNKFHHQNSKLHNHVIGE